MKSYFDLTENEKIDFLSKEFKSKRPLIPQRIKLSSKDQETWETFKMISDTPKEFLGAYVISMTSSASDILLHTFRMKIAEKCGGQYHNRRCRK